MMGNSIFGMPVYSSNHVPNKVPREMLSTKVDVSDEFRKKYNVWLKEYFGEKEVVYVIDPTITYPYKKYMGTTNKAIVGNTLTIEKLKQAVKVIEDINGTRYL